MLNAWGARAWTRGGELLKLAWFVCLLVVGCNDCPRSDPTHVTPNGQLARVNHNLTSDELEVLDEVYDANPLPPGWMLRIEDPFFAGCDGEGACALLECKIVRPAWNPDPKWLGYILAHEAGHAWHPDDPDYGHK